MRYCLHFLLFFYIISSYGKTINIQKPNDSLKQVVGMVVFKEHSIYTANNSLYINNKALLIVCPTIILSDKEIKKSISTKNEDIEKEVVKNNLKLIKKKQSETLIFNGNSPFSNNSIYISINNTPAVLTSTSRKYKVITKKYDNRKSLNISISTFLLKNCFEIAIAQSLLINNIKQPFQITEIVFNGCNYSRTSKIRPPPII